MSGFLISFPSALPLEINIPPCVMQLWQLSKALNSYGWGIFFQTSWLMWFLKGGGEGTPDNFKLNCKITLDNCVPVV